MRLETLYRSVVETTSDVPYPLLLRAAGWLAVRELATLPRALHTTLTFADAVAILDLVPARSGHRDSAAVVAVLTRADVPVENAPGLVAAERRKKTRAVIAARAQSPHVLAQLTGDADAATLQAVATNDAAGPAIRIHAVLRLEDLYRAATPSSRRHTDYCQAMRDAAAHQPAEVAAEVAEHHRTPELGLRLCDTTLPAPTACRLIERHLSVELAAGNAQLLALHAAERLTRHPDRQVRDTLTGTLRQARHPSVAAEVGRLLRLLERDDVARTGGGDLVWLAQRVLRPTETPDEAATARSLLDRLADLDPHGWVTFERLADTFTGAATELLDVTDAVAGSPTS